MLNQLFIYILDPKYTIVSMLIVFTLGIFLLYAIGDRFYTVRGVINSEGPGEQVFIIRKGGLILSLVPLFWSIYIWYLFDGSLTTFQMLSAPFSFINNTDTSNIIRGPCFGVDGVGLSLLLLTAALFPICIILMNTFVGIMTFLLLELSILVSLLVLDLLGFYISFEASLILLFLLIARTPYGSIDAAYKIVLYTVGGSFFFLPVVFILYSDIGTTNLLSLVCCLDTHMTQYRQYLIGWGMLAVFAVKIPLIPLHLWLPEAHVAAPTAGSVLLAGVLLKLGSLGLIRFMIPIIPKFSVYVFPFVGTLCLISFLWSTLSTIKQVDLKKVVAYSSIAHMALITLAIMSMSEYNVFSSTYMMIAHGIISPGLFLLVGFLYERTHTKYIAYLSGLGSYMPIYGVIFFLLTCANLSFPLSPNFIAEVLCLISIFAVHELYTFIFCAAQVLGAVYAFWTYNRVSHGVFIPTYRIKATSTIGIVDLTRLEIAILTPVILGIIWLGIKPMT